MTELYQSWSHGCAICGRIYTNTQFQQKDYTCDGCKAKQAALKLPLATAVADPYLSLPMSPERLGRKPSRIDEPHPVAKESLERGTANAARQAKNRAVLRRWKKKP